MYTAHIDTFARDNLPPAEQQPEFLFDLPELQFPERLNCATELLDKRILAGDGDRVCLRTADTTWTYADLLEKANRIANVLVHEMGLQPGNRVLLRSANNPMLAACWFAVVKAGGIVVTTMPLFRASELITTLDIGQITHALCDYRLADEMDKAAGQSSTLKELRYFHDDGPMGLEAAMAKASPHFDNVDTASNDTCIFGFTSGTTGIPKVTMHYHRDVMAICHCWPVYNLRPTADDVFIGSPPFAFTFGLGGLLLFPMSVGASAVLLERAGPEQLIDGITNMGATVVFTAPTAYRLMAEHGEALRRTALRKCVSAGEVLPAATRALWKAATGIELIDGIGATEMLHIFISHDESNARPGATGIPVKGYRAKVIDDEGNEVPPGTVGHLAVQGPTGCRYLSDERQKTYVRDGWNITGDAYLMDEDGYFYYQARTDDIIVSSGYNIAAPSVEEALLQHQVVAECAVVGLPDEARGQIVKAFIVLREDCQPSEALTKEIQDFVKSIIAPYKYPRAIEFVTSLPRTPTGKIQRFKLQEAAS